MDIPFTGLLAAFALTGGLAWLAAGRRRGPVGITAALLVVQGALHLAFSGSQSGTGAARHRMAGMDMSGTDPAGTGMAGMSGMSGMHMAGTGTGTGAGTHLSGMADGSGLAGMPGMPGMPGMSGMAGMSHAADAVGMAGMAGHGHGGLGMIAAHVLAALFCAAWLARGEAAVFRLAGTLAATALLAARPLSRAFALLGQWVAPLPPRPAHCPPYERPRRLRGAVHAHAMVRRGPPGGFLTRATAPGRPARA